MGLACFSVVQRFPRRGGNYNNGGNMGLGYENCNNPRSNANRNYGARPPLPAASKRPDDYASRPFNLFGRGAFPSGEYPVNEKPGDDSRGHRCEAPGRAESYGCPQHNPTAYAQRKRHAQQNGVTFLEKLHDLKDRICSFDNLLAAYREAARGKRYRNEVITFSFGLEENLLEIQRELLDRSYTVGNYREFYVRYPKPRLVMALGFRDRIVQWAIYRQINPYMEKRFIQHSYGCRQNKGTLAAAQCLLNWVRLISRKPDAKDWAIVKGDISKYFYRVDHEVILRIYSQITDDEWFLWLIGTIINNPDLPFGLPEGASIDDCPRDRRLYEVGMPIGNLTSQETANIYLDRLDQFVKHSLRQRFYLRYMDDFAIICKRDEAKVLLETITAFLRAELRLTISPKSNIVPATQPVEFVGYLITPHGMRLRKKTTRHIKRALMHLSERYAEGEIRIDEALQAVNSYHGLTKHCNGYNLRRWIEENIVFSHQSSPEGKIIYEQI